MRKACRYFVVSRSAVSLLKKAHEAHRDEKLVNRKPCLANPKLRTPPEAVEKSLTYSTYYLGPARSVWYLERYHGIMVSHVYRILRRHGLNRLPARVGRRAVHTPAPRSRALQNMHVKSDRKQRRPATRKRP